MTRATGPRSFVPVRVANLETDAWAAFLKAAVGMVGAGFGVGRIGTVRGAWYVARPAAQARVAAMGLSDRWVEAGCDLDDPLSVQERDRPVASCTALPKAV